MDRDEAISVASKWIQHRYPVAPAVAQAFQFTDDVFTEESLALHPQINQEKVRDLIGKWLVAFSCSWDTDALGMPQRLGVVVDNHTREVELAFDGLSLGGSPTRCGRKARFAAQLRCFVTGGCPIQSAGNTTFSGFGVGGDGHATRWLPQIDSP